MHGDAFYRQPVHGRWPFATSAGVAIFLHWRTEEKCNALCDTPVYSVPYTRNVPRYRRPNLEFKVTDTEQTELTMLTVDLLSAYVTNNSVPASDLAELIKSTHLALAAIDAPAPVEPAAPVFEPAVTVRKSLASPDHILSMIDGKPYKTLKRHLTGHGLTPAEYRQRYKLANDYPMVAPAYSEQRRLVAKRLGLGRKRTAAPANAPVSMQAAANPAADNKAPRKSAKPAGGARGKTKAAPEASPVDKIVKPAPRRRKLSVKIPA